MFIKLSLAKKSELGWINFFKIFLENEQQKKSRADVFATGIAVSAFVAGKRIKQSNFVQIVNRKATVYNCLLPQE